MYACICIFIFIYKFIYISIYVYTCLHIHILIVCMNIYSYRSKGDPLPPTDINKRVLWDQRLSWDQPVGPRPEVPGPGPSLGVPGPGLSLGADGPGRSLGVNGPGPSLGVDGSGGVNNLGLSRQGLAALDRFARQSKPVISEDKPAVLVKGDVDEQKQGTESGMYTYPYIYVYAYMNVVTIFK
jgi:hypothetical protein